MAHAEGFIAFWSEYPRRVARLPAEKAYNRAIKSGVSHARIMDGLAAYKLHKPAFAGWAHGASWLNAGRWDDEWGQPEQNTPVDWFDECKAMHDGACGLSRMRHDQRKQMDAMRRATV